MATLPGTPVPARLFVPFFIGSLVLTLSWGATLGMINLARLTGDWGWGTMPQSSVLAHAYVKVFGFMALFVMGVAYHVMPRFVGTTLRQPRAVLWSFWLQLAGVLAIAIGFFAGEPMTRPFWIAGSVSLVAASILFRQVIVRTLAAGAGSTEPFQRWVVAGVLWLVISSALALTAALTDDVRWHRVLWNAALFGFAGCWIFGVSRRILPMFLGCRPHWPAFERPVFVCYVLGVVGWSVGAWPHEGPVFTAARSAGAVLLIASVVGYTASLGLFQRAAQLIHHPPDRSPQDGWQRYIFAAWGWLFVGLAVGPAWTSWVLLRDGAESVLLLDVARHAVAFGFATQMILGVASRVVPNFTGNPLWSPAARAAAFWCLNGSMALRALEIPVGLGFWPSAWSTIAYSGPFGVVAIGLFAVNIMMTVKTRPRLDVAA